MSADRSLDRSFGIAAAAVAVSSLYLAGTVGRGPTAIFIALAALVGISKTTTA